jgi:alkylhydroperoxidase family enzyme
VYEDYRTAPVPEGLRAALWFVRKMTLTPDELGPEDARAVLAAGVREQALIDAITVSFHFNMVDRVADSLGFDQRSPEEHMKAAQSMLKHGYRLPAPLRLLGRIPTW